MSRVRVTVVKGTHSVVAVVFIMSEELQLLPIDARMEAGVRCDMVVCVVVLDASN